MSIDLVNIGLAANDGTGDDLREAMIKINNNFTQLDLRANQVGANLGSAGAEVYKNADQNTLYFRRLVAGTNIGLTQNDNTIVVNNTMPNTYVISTDSGSIIAGASVNYNIIGNQAVTVSANENNKTITISSNLQQDTNPILGASLNANNLNITNVNNLTANSILSNTLSTTDFSTVNINGINYYNNLGRYLTGFDFGDLDDNIDNILEWLVVSTGVDFGTFTSPTPGNVDLGNL